MTDTITPEMKTPEAAQMVAKCLTEIDIAKTHNMNSFCGRVHVTDTVIMSANIVKTIVISQSRIRNARN